MTKLAAIVAGGTKETLRFLKGQMKEYSQIINFVTFLVVLGASITGIKLYNKYQARQLRRLE
jgi:hypothetical protein